MYRPFILLLMTSLTQAQSGITLFYNVTEEQPASTLIGNLSMDAGLHRRYSDEELQLLDYQFMEQNAPEHQSLFQLTPSFGVLSTAVVIDRDKICPQQDECDVTMNVIIFPVEYFQVIKVQVSILDQNDNAPTFTKNYFELEIPENAVVGTTFSLPSTIDLDSGQYGVKDFTLTASDDTKDHFELVNISDSEIALGLSSPLDREQEDRYVLIISAEDGGVPPRTGSITVVVIVEDFNDNNPVFRQEEYFGLVSDTTPLNSILVTVSATDADDGNNGLLTYEFTSQTALSYGQLFSIDEQTGDVTLQSRPHFESREDYVLNVIARDGGQNALVAYTTVVIQVDDSVNRNPPVIDVNTLMSDGYAHVDEEADVGRFVAHVSVSDPDSGDHPNINCSIDNNDFALQRIDIESFTIVTARVFDREFHTEYHVNIMCQDNGQPVLTATRHIPILITDVNDNTPRFDKERYTGSVFENSENGTILATVHATDLDTGSNAEIMYEIADDSFRSLVAVNETSGVVRVNGVLNHEAANHLEIIILAIDHGEPARTSSTMLYVTILDENDEPPVFVVQNYYFNVSENAAIFSRVGQIKALDLDTFPFNECVYAIEPSGSDNASVPFEIDPNDGSIVTSDSLDRETNALYAFSVVATNTAAPRRSASTSVVIEVLDVNDNYPEIIFPNTSTIEVSDKIPLNHVAFTIRAIDADTSRNALLSYFIEKSDSDFFSLDEQTGGMIVVNDLSKFPNKETHFEVTVIDRGKPPLSTPFRFSVKINPLIPFVPSDLPMVTSPVAARSEGQWGTTDTISIVSALSVFLLLLFILLVAALINRHRHRKKKTALEKVNQGQPTGKPVEKERTSMIKCEDQAHDDSGLSMAADFEKSRLSFINIGVEIGESETEDPYSIVHRDLNRADVLLANGKFRTASIASGDSGTRYSLQNEPTNPLDVSWSNYSGSVLFSDPKTRRHRRNARRDDMLYIQNEARRIMASNAWDTKRNQRGTQSDTDEFSVYGRDMRRRELSPGIEEDNRSDTASSLDGRVIAHPNWQRYGDLNDQGRLRRPPGYHQPRHPRPLSTPVINSLNRGRKESALTVIELQAHDVLQNLGYERGDSETGSFTDSGRGPSEEGEAHNRVPPMEPRIREIRRGSKLDYARDGRELESIYEGLQIHDERPGQRVTNDGECAEYRSQNRPPRAYDQQHLKDDNSDRTHRRTPNVGAKWQKALDHVGARNRSPIVFRDQPRDTSSPVIREPNFRDSNFRDSNFQDSNFRDSQYDGTWRHELPPNSTNQNVQLNNSRNDEFSNCIKDVIEQYVPLNKEQRDKPQYRYDDETATTTSGSYIIDDL